MQFNWVAESVSGTPGTGTISLGGAEAGHIALVDVIQDGQLVKLQIEDGNNRETGWYTFTDGAPDTLARTTITETLVSGTHNRTTATAISLTSAATVRMAADASMVSTGGVCYEGTYGESSGHLSNAAGLTQSTLSANKAYAIPFVRKKAGLVSKVGFELSAVAGTKIRVGIYDVLSTGLPGKLIATTADITPSAAIIDASLSASIFLSPSSTICTALIQDGVNTWRLLNLGDAMHSFAGLATADDPAQMFSVSAAAWTAFPDPFGTPTIEGFLNIPFMRLLE